MSPKKISIAIYGAVFLLVVLATVYIGGKLRDHWWPEKVNPDSANSSGYTRSEAILNTYPDGAYLAAGEQGSETFVSSADIAIIDIHEHVQYREDGLRLLQAMDRNNVEKACILGASIFTFTLDSRYGFERIDENNQLLLELKREFPQRFCVFVTIDPEDPEALARLKGYKDAGADGLKLYLGHGAGTGKGPFHTMALDDPRMLPIYQWAENAEFPLTFHVNLNKYYAEFEKVMAQFPAMRVNLPHLGLHSASWSRLARLSALLERFPSLYTDISYGWYVFHIEGFENLAENRGVLREFIRKFSDRILFGADMVVEFTKDLPTLTQKIESYRQILELPEFTFYLKPERRMHGLGLSREVLQQIYQHNPERFLAPAQ